MAKKKKRLPLLTLEQQATEEFRLQQEQIAGRPLRFVGTRADLLQRRTTGPGLVPFFPSRREREQFTLSQAEQAAQQRTLAGIAPAAPAPPTPAPITPAPRTPVRQAAAGPPTVPPIRFPERPLVAPSRVLPRPTVLGAITDGLRTEARRRAGLTGAATVDNVPAAPMNRRQLLIENLRRRAAAGDTAAKDALGRLGTR